MLDSFYFLQVRDIKLLVFCFGKAAILASYLTLTSSFLLL